ncbi:hypothetical protein QFW77_15775 [Luteimonas sp. RD2P54]|uniref:DUF4175 domain-containing protein n=1 Tax=Luteimonas endophytica TaxID=3042023 RepID=A0ABT6JC95_9GAMM|nr:hypothetical protein [Luteimonas endophytica]MDH5824433.1 hypothetical protein [Luteimonas endophytica]
MNAADRRLSEALRAARWRSALDVALCALPLAGLAAAVGWRAGGGPAAAIATTLALLATGAVLVWRLRREDLPRLLRRLDARQRQFEDSAGLLLAGEPSLGPLQRLQRERLRQRLGEAPAPDLRLPWSRRRNLLAWLLALPLAAGVLLWPVPERERAAVRETAAAGGAGAAAPRLVAHTLRIEPPAYTALPARQVDGLEAKAPTGSRLRWALRFSPRPAAAALVFHDGARLELARDGDTWRASHVLERATLYRVVAEGAPARPPPPLQRLDAIVDRAPRVRVLAPERTLTQMQPGQRSWALAFQASDDYGVATEARLRVTLARGTGENISFEERGRTLRGAGERTERRFEARLDLAELALAPGEDLVVQLEVRDNRAPRPQSARSPSLILRRPAEPVADVAGLEGLARKVLPAYFRSQRQIIIDAEALLAQRARLDGEAFLARSDRIGVDQRLLRLRYGQFLGEESEGGPRPLPTADADDHAHEDAASTGPVLPIDDFGQEPRAGESDGDAGHGEDGHDHADGGEIHQGVEEAAGSSAAAGPGDDHDHAGAGAEPGGMVFGRAQDVLAEFGHTHDIPEAATLLDPQTRETLRGALREMWQSELHLRQGAPAEALPYAYRALELIKQVQQADRIYLARVGPELPPIDPSRRLGGEREGIARRALPAAAAERDADVPARLWRALGEDADAAAETADLAALEAWLRDNEPSLEDPLALVAAIDALRNAPGCDDCRRALRALLWTALAPPPAAVPRREAGDAQARRYLDALGPGALDRERAR